MKKLVASAVLAAVVVAVAACGGGSSGWSKTDEQQFRDDHTFNDTECFLRVAEQHFRSYDEYAREAGTHVYDEPTEAGKRFENDGNAKCS